MILANTNLLSRRFLKRMIAIYIDILDYNLDRSTTSSVLKSILSVDTETQTT